MRYFLKNDDVAFRDVTEIWKGYPRISIPYRTRSSFVHSWWSLFLRVQFWVCSISNCVSLRMKWLHTWDVKGPKGALLSRYEKEMCRKLTGLHSWGFMKHNLKAKWCFFCLTFFCRHKAKQQPHIFCCIFPLWILVGCVRMKFFGLNISNPNSSRKRETYLLSIYFILCPSRPDEKR